MSHNRSYAIHQILWALRCIHQLLNSLWASLMHHSRFIYNKGKSPLSEKVIYFCLVAYRQYVGNQTSLLSLEVARLHPVAHCKSFDNLLIVHPFHYGGNDFFNDQTCSTLRFSMWSLGKQPNLTCRLDLVIITCHFVFLSIRWVSHIIFKLPYHNSSDIIKFKDNCWLLLLFIIARHLLNLIPMYHISIHGSPGL